jgi:peptide/nickel transport system permease protein
MYVTRRVAQMLITLILASFVIYAAVSLTPGGQILAFSAGGRRPSPQEVAVLTRQYHLDESLPQRYLWWLGNAVKGDFGQSPAFREPVSTIIAPRIATTLTLVIMASILIISVGTSLGVISALRGQALDTTILVGTVIGMATPAFVSAILLITVFSVDLRWFPVLGSGNGFGSRIYHLILPAIALAIAQVAYVARVSRAAVREQAGKEFVEMATVRGLPRRLVVRRHILRNALIPIVTVSGLTIAGLFGWTVIVEQVFSLNGLGALLVESVDVKDVPTAQATLLIFVSAFIVINAVIDISYSVIDPRVAAAGPRG